MVRLHAEDSLSETLIRIGTARIAGCETELSQPPGFRGSTLEFLESPEGQLLLENTRSVEETDEQLAGRLGRIDRLRYAAPERVPREILEVAAREGFYVSRRMPVSEGRLEMLHCLYEQSISVDWHRYGNLGEREAGFD